MLKAYLVNTKKNLEDAVARGFAPPSVSRQNSRVPAAIPEVARAMKKSPRAIRDAVKRLEEEGHPVDWSGYNQNCKESTQDSRDVEISRLRDQVSVLQSQNKSLLSDRAQQEELREFITSVRSDLPDIPSWTTATQPPGSLGVPLTLWSDWHIGEVVSKAQVGGINEFDMEIAERRVQRLVKRIIHLSFDYWKDPEYPGIVVCLGGDMISGRIHEELSETMVGPFSGQILATYRLIGQGLTSLADRFGRVFVPAVVGNHGRMHHKPRAKNRVQDSYEYLIYHFLADRFRDDERIVFFIPEQTDALFEVAGHRFLMTHGDSMGAKGGDGIIGAIGPIVRGEKKVREVAGFTKDDYDTALIGHYHTAIALDRLVVNGALKGYDEFARNVMRAPPELPSQWLLFVHTDYGIVDAKRIYLEDKPKLGKVSEFTSWPQ